tara:strand:- start:2354 stop:2800 length:447 start_codon:yes stop_codon:yes gene_type:complete
MAREMLKLRKGDTAIAIKKDGSLQLAGLNGRPMIDDKGMISPVLLFAAAWAKKDPEVMQTLFENFKSCVKEGYFGPDAQRDYKAMEDAATSGTVTKKLDEEKLEAIAEQGQDPKVESQMKKMTEGAEVVEEKPFVGHMTIEETDKQIL